MGEPLDQRLGRLVLGQELLFARDAQVLVDLMEFDQQFGLCIEMVQGENGAVHRDGTSIMECQGQFPLGERVSGVQGLRETPIDLGIGTVEHGGRRPTDHLSGTELKEHFSRRVEVLEAQVGAEQHHCRIQVIENPMFEL